MTQQQLSEFEQFVPRAVKDALQKAPYLMQAFVEGHVDDHGPPRGVRSTSRQWGPQSFRLSRSLTPRQDENISNITIENGRVTLEYGTKVFYGRFLEDGTSRMSSRPYLKPGFEDFIREGLPRLQGNLMDQLTRKFNAQ